MNLITGINRAPVVLFYIHITFISYNLHLKSNRSTTTFYMNNIHKNINNMTIHNLLKWHIWQLILFIFS